MLSALGANMCAFSGWGSEATHLARYGGPLRSIGNHDKGTVRRWAKKMLKHVEQYSQER